MAVIISRPYRYEHGQPSPIVPVIPAIPRARATVAAQAPAAAISTRPASRVTKPARAWA